MTVGILLIGYLFNVLIYAQEDRHAHHRSPWARLPQLPARGGERPRRDRLASVEAEVVKVTDGREIAAHGIISTPGLVIDGRVVSSGRIPTARGHRGLAIGVARLTFKSLGRARSVRPASQAPSTALQPSVAMPRTTWPTNPRQWVSIG